MLSMQHSNRAISWGLFSALIYLQLGFLWSSTSTTSPSAALAALPYIDTGAKRYYVNQNNDILTKLLANPEFRDWYDQQQALGKRSGSGDDEGEGGDDVKRGYPVLKRGYPVLKRGYPVLKRGYPVLKRGYPIIKKGYPVLKRGYPVLKRGYPMLKKGYPVLKRGYPVLKRGYPVLKRGYPVLKRGYPVLKRGYPVLKRGYPVLKRGYPVLKRGYPVLKRDEFGVPVWDLGSDGEGRSVRDTDPEQLIAATKDYMREHAAEVDSARPECREENMFDVDTTGEGWLVELEGRVRDCVKVEEGEAEGNEVQRVVATEEKVEKVQEVPAGVLSADDSQTTTRR